MALSTAELAEIRLLLWSVLDRLDAAAETEAAALLARVLDVLPAGKDWSN